jgi:hypothetical protein
VSEVLLDSAFFKAEHTPFEVIRRLVLSLILLHANYGNIVFTGADSASQKRLGGCIQGLFALYCVDCNWYFVCE